MMKRLTHKNTLLKTSLLSILILLLFTASCKKKNNEQPSPDTGDKTPPVTTDTSKFLNPVANVNTMYEGFLRAFMVKSNGQTYLVDGLNKRDRAYFWGQGFMITSLIDVYERSPSKEKAQLINDLLSSFLNKETSDWSWNSWTDDIAWAAIACIRGYQVTGNTAFRDAAINNWNFAFNRGWDDIVGGGLWENTDKHTKAALSNNPMIISGTFIYEVTNDVNYLNKCKQIYAWEKSSGLYDPNTGVVNEAIVNDGTKQISDNSYNTGSFINAATSLYKYTKDSQYLNDAKTAADHVLNKFGVMNQEGGACVRGIAKLARENGLESKYYPWLVRQCVASWNNRSKISNITNNNWREITPGNGEQFAMQCISAVTVQAVTPKMKMAEIPEGNYKVISKSNEFALSTVNNGTENNTKLNASEYEGDSGQLWTLSNINGGIYKLIGSNNKKSINVSGDSGDDDANIILWDYNDGGNEKIYFMEGLNGYYNIFVVNSGKAISINTSSSEKTIVQSAVTNGEHQLWKFIKP